MALIHAVPMDSNEIYLPLLLFQPKVATVYYFFDNSLSIPPYPWSSSPLMFLHIF